jgi:hypothetical protein
MVKSARPQLGEHLPSIGADYQEVVAEEFAAVVSQDRCEADKACPQLVAGVGLEAYKSALNWADPAGSQRATGAERVAPRFRLRNLDLKEGSRNSG